MFFTIASLAKIIIKINPNPYPNHKANHTVPSIPVLQYLVFHHEVLVSLSTVGK